MSKRTKREEQRHRKAKMKKQEELKTQKLKYSILMGYDFTQLISRLANTNTISTKANTIHKITKQVVAARAKIKGEFEKELKDKYAQRDDAGKIIAPDDDPLGFTTPDDKVQEFAKAQEDFGEREIEITAAPLRPWTLSDVAVSAKDLDMLGDLYCEENGPGVPVMGQDQAGNVHNLHQ